jgi:hypothetical protein
MRTQLKIGIAALLSSVTGLWLAPMGHAYEPYDSPSRVHREEHQLLHEEHRLQHAQLQKEYDRAMDRLARQERAAQKRAYRRYGGDTADPRYRRLMAAIDRKYDRKRAQVERQLAREHRGGHQELAREHKAFHRTWAE